MDDPQEGTTQDRHEETGGPGEYIEPRIHPGIRYGRPPAWGSIWAGLFILLVGGVLLLDQMGFPLPDWLFNWHTLLVVIGLFIGLRHNFRGGAWAILMLVGGAFLYQDYYPHAQIHRFIWPCIMIFIGLMIMLRPRRSWVHYRDWNDENWKDHWKAHKAEWKANRDQWKADKDQWKGNSGQWKHHYRNQWRERMYNSTSSYSSEDFIDATSIFGGVHKKVVSKNFKGGDIVTILGGSEIDLSQADFTGRVRLDVTQVMGGTKIIVPPHWEVRTEVSAIFAGFEDKRQQPALLNPDKILIIDGTSIFGGIELKNY